jgi:DNA-binding MarR family transcriptional regulator
MTRQHLVEHTTALYVNAITLFDPIRFRAWSDLGLTLPTLKVIFLLREQAGAPSGVLAARLRVTPSTITGLVDRLVNQQLVRREEDAKDRRLVRNFLTDRGLAAVGDLERQARELMSGILEEMSDEEIDQVIAGLEILAAASKRHSSRHSVAV